MEFNGKKFNFSKKKTNPCKIAFRANGMTTINNTIYMIGQSNDQIYTVTEYYDCVDRHI